MYRYGYVPADVPVSYRQKRKAAGRNEGKGRVVLAYSSTEDSAEDAWSYFSKEEYVRGKTRRLGEMRQNRVRLAESEKRIGKRLRRRRRKRVALGIVAILAAVFTVGMIRFRRAGEAGSNRVWIWQDRDRTTESAAGQEIDPLMLVNKEYALPDGYLPRLHWLENKSCAVAEEMYPALKMMLTDGTEEGLQFVVASGYRDSELQKKLLDEDIEASMESEGLTWQQAYDKETRETMPPGHSEHETGLAADIVSLDYQVLDAQQEDTAECRWLQENCSRYGFILRYPRGKEEITQVDYEPWHFRYVGAEAAQEIMSRGITLEEYLGKTGESE